MNDKPINLTKSLQFDDFERINLTLSPKPEFYEPMETAPPIEKDVAQNNW